MIFLILEELINAKDWKSMINFLLSNTNLENSNVRSLVEFVLFKIKEAKNCSKLLNEWIEITVFLIPSLVLLLKKYIKREEIVACLLNIPIYFELYQYKEKKLLNFLNDLLEVLKYIFLNSINKNILNSCSICLLHLECCEVIFYSVHSKLKFISDHLVDNINNDKLCIQHILSFTNQHNIICNKKKIYEYIINHISTNVLQKNYQEYFDLMKNILLWYKLDTMNSNGIKYTNLLNEFIIMSTNYYNCLLELKNLFSQNEIKIQIYEVLISLILCFNVKKSDFNIQMDLIDLNLIREHLIEENMNKLNDFDKNKVLLYIDNMNASNEIVCIQTIEKLRLKSNDDRNIFAVLLCRAVFNQEEFSNKCCRVNSSCKKLLNEDKLKFVKEKTFQFFPVTIIEDAETIWKELTIPTIHKSQRIQDNRRQSQVEYQTYHISKLYINTVIL